MRCWTVQEREFLVQDGVELRCTRAQEMPGWRLAYDWMREAYIRRIGTAMGDQPLWLWEKPNGRVSKKARHETALALMGSASGLDDMVCLDVDVPDGIALRSSYQMWNCLVDYCMLFGRRPAEASDWDGMFRDAPLRHGDSMQVVVPAVQRKWIQRVVEFDAELLRELEG